MLTISYFLTKLIKFYRIFKIDKNCLNWQKLSKLSNIFKNSQNCQKLSKLSKFDKIVNNFFCQNVKLVKISKKMSKLTKIVKIGKYCQNCQKFSKILKIFTNCQVVSLQRVFITLIKCFKGHSLRVFLCQM